MVLQFRIERIPTLSAQNIIEKAPFCVMGIVNVTPDSFFDGGNYFSLQKAIDHAMQLADEGATILDIGGQSTRPGASLIDADEECRRVIPVIDAIVKTTRALISVDTFNARTARCALDAGAGMINDISAGRFDSGMPALIAEKGCPIVLMHSRETPGTMQNHPSYNNVIAEVKNELLERVAFFVSGGVLAENIIVDPGIGFAKRFEDNIDVLGAMDEIVAIGHCVCLGVSRKTFIGHITGEAPSRRLPGSLAAITPAFKAGVKIFRVHDVEETVQFLNVLHAIMGNN